MKRNGSFAALFLLTLSALSFQPLVAQKNDREPYLTKSFAGQNVTSVESKTSGGNITVTGGQGESRLEMYVSPNNGKSNSLTKEEIQQRLDEYYDITIGVNSGKLTAIAKAKDWHMNWKKALGISFVLVVPTDVATELTTSGGNISLSSLNGAQEFTTSGGNLTIDKIKGKVKGRTSGGNIHVTNSSDDLDLSTSGGNIVAEGSSGTLTLATSGGNLNLRELKGKIKGTTSGGNIVGDNISDELEAHTSGGNISFRNLTCALETSTSGGNIDVELKELGARTSITNSSGTIALTMPGNKGADLKLNASKIKTNLLADFKGIVEDDRIEGKLNGGGATVRVDAGGGGRINLKIAN